MTAPLHWLVVVAMVVPAAVPAQATKVGPPRGTVIVVGGGAMGPEVYGAFIKAAGGADALIVDVPTAGGAATYGQDDASARAWRNAGAHHVVVLHTTDRKLADSDSFAAVLKTAGGVWFEGGRQFHLVDSYAGTKTEQAFHDVLARGGVVGGSSAGATILGDFLVRGAPSNDNTIMDDARYEKGFAFLRGVGIDQHVVARERLADLADSIVPKYPKLLGMSEDEGTAWVVQGDVATIIGRNKAFVYGTPLHDLRKPFLTLHPGDKYNLATRQVTHRAVDESSVSEAFVDALFKKYTDSAAGGATVLVARDGHVLIDKSYGIPDQPKYMPTTTVPQFSLGGISAVFTALCEQLPAPAPARGTTADSSAPAAGRGGRGAVNNDTPLQSCVTRRISTPIGMHKTMATADGDVHSSVDELYRLALGIDGGAFVRAVPASAATDPPARPFDGRRGFQPILMEAGSARVGAFGMADGKRSAFVQVPESHITVIILTNDAAADARGMALGIVNRLAAPQR
jgi:cyanophycinase